MLGNQEKQLRTPLKRVRGLGSAHEGVKHWWQTRLTSIALIPLTLWFIWNALRFAGSSSDYEDARVWAAIGFNSVLLITLTAIMFLHAASGIQAVLEDYVHSEGRKLVFIYTVKTVLFLLGASTIFAILGIAFRP